MTPTTFPEQTTTLAKDQPEYLPLPCYQDKDETISRWSLTWLERIRILFGGTLWLRQSNFGRPLQPQRPTLDYPFLRGMRPQRMRGAGLALAFLLLPACASAQVTDSVIVTVVDRSGFAAVITTDTTRLRGAPGDTVTFEAIVFDAVSGDTIEDATIRWTSNSAVVEIDAVTGFATFFGGCGASVCRATVFADVTEIVGSAVLSSFPDGVWRIVGAAGTFDPPALVAYILPAPECLLWDMASGVPDGLGGWAIEPDCTLRDEPTSDLLCAYLTSASGLWYRSGDRCPSRPPGLGLSGQPFPLPIDSRAGALLG